MHNKQKLKKLAVISAATSTIPNDIEEFVLNYLSKAELKEFLSYFEIELNKKRVFAVTPEALSDYNLKLLRKRYTDKEILPIIDKSLGAGLKLIEGDMVVDFTVKNYINDTIEKLKN